MKAIAQTLRDVSWIFRQELRIARRDSTIFAIMFVMPFVVLYLVAPAMRPALIQQGFAEASGAEQAMPGMAVLFSNFAMAFLAFAVFREHTWSTWDRLMIAPFSRFSVLAGKALLPFFAVVAQQLTLLAAASIVFDVKINGAGFIAYLALSFALAAFAVCAGLALTAWLASLQEINSIVNIGTFVLAGVGGAFGPIELMPAWIQSISVLSPNFWAIDGFKQVLLNDAGIGAVLPGAAILLGCAAACLALALMGLAGEREKRAWA
ncbi:MAG: ABC transporter permease [bacterium]|nr:ABC transporter permease [bacterium]